MITMSHFLGYDHLVIFLYSLGCDRHVTFLGIWSSCHIPLGYDHHVIFPWVGSPCRTQLRCDYHITIPWVWLPCHTPLRCDRYITLVGLDRHVHPFALKNFTLACALKVMIIMSCLLCLTFLPWDSLGISHLSIVLSCRIRG